jgi:hypothetical protein
MAEDTGAAGASGQSTTDTTDTTEGQQQGAQGQQQGTGEGTTRSAEEYRKELRQYERTSKAASERKDAELSELKGKLDQFEQASQTETEKAIGQAKKDARAEAETEFEKERRGDRLQVAVAKHARDLADVDDVIYNLQGEGVDGYFDKDGKVKPDALKSGIDDLLSRKAHLKAGPQGRPTGTADGGEGEAGSGVSMNDLMRAARG